jgi:hypothetical protein
VTLGSPFQLDLILESNTCIEEEVGSVQVILQWNAALFRLDGKVDTGPFPWAFSGFPVDSALDGLNNPFTGVPASDGLVSYLAFVGFDSRAPVGPGGLVVTSFQFTAVGLAAGGGTTLSVPDSWGSFSTSAVLGRLGAGSDVDMTGTLGSANVTIVECTSNPDCNDGNLCTNDSCSGGLCVHTSNVLPCDDGLFCTAVDTCVSGVCVGAGDSCPSDPFCNENLNACVECLGAGDCDDANPCTNNVCSPLGSCNFPSNTNSCNDGLFCTINDVCSFGSCVGGGPRCPVMCNESINACVDCLTNTDCSDGNVCTTDSCSSGFCFNVNNTLPCNDGKFCTVTDTCSSGLCQGAGDPCFGTGLVCDESDDSCQECVVSQDCNDGNTCTDDLCISRSCFNPNNTAPCEDGQFCTTSDQCAGGVCFSGTGNACSGASSTPVCDEAGDRCVECLIDYCESVSGVCSNTPDHSSCDDGLFCTGAEVCDSVLDCVASVNPCGSAPLCDESSDRCVCNDPTLSGAGSRYLRIVPGQGFIPVAFRVSSNSPRLSCLPRYVDQDGRLVVTPFFRTPAEWGAEVYVSDRFIEPGTLYTVESDCRIAPSDPPNLSGSDSTFTMLVGDTNNTKSVDLDDVLHILDVFSEVTSFSDLARADLMLCQTDGIVDLEDILAVLSAFEGDPYPCFVPCP